MALDGGYRGEVDVTTKKTKDTITEKIGQVYEFDGPLDGLEDRIRKEFARRGLEKYTNLELIQGIYEGYGDDGPDLNLYGTRPMTDKELAKREAKEAKERENARREAMEKRDLELHELARLKAKYE